MTTNETGDPILQLLARLPSATPPPAVDARVRSRCHRALEKERSRPPRLITAALTMTAGIYAAAAALETLRLVGLL
jgi:hypothetical protein